MAMVAFLVERDPDVMLGPAVAERLASLGVTNVSLLRDRDVMCVVLEGWAFDPASSTEAAAAIGADASSRIFRPVIQSALRPSIEET